MQAVDAYHSAVAPATQFLEQTLAVPADVAPILALSGSIFVPLFFLTAWYASTFGFTGKTKWEMASSVPSFVHGCTTCVAAPLLIWRQYQSEGDLSGSAPNTPAQIALLQFSCAYFLHDLVVYVGVFARHEIMFGIHHLAVLIYMVMTMRLGIAASTALVAIGIGEVTSPLQNIWFILKNVRYKSQAADSVFKYLSWLYAAFYFFCRSNCGPAVMAYDAWTVWHTPELELPVRCLFVFLLLGGAFATQSWSIRISKRLVSNYKPAYGTHNEKLVDIDDISTDLDNQVSPKGNGKKKQ